jgi:AcrR family transcriptional regulator
MSGPARTDPTRRRHAELVEAALGLFGHGVRSLVSLRSVGWAATADPGAAARYFGSEDELIRAAVERVGRPVLRRVQAQAAVLDTLGPADAELVVAAFTVPIRQIESSTLGRGWIRMLVLLEPDERHHTTEWMQSVVDALLPLAGKINPRAPRDRVAQALRTAVQMVVGAVAHYSDEVPPKDWSAIEGFAAGGLLAVLRRSADR